MTFIIEKVANMVFVSSGEQVWKAWDENSFTDRKLNNLKKKLQSNHVDEIVFINNL